MNIQVLIVIAVNLTLLILVSWVFFIFTLGSFKQTNTRLSRSLDAAIKAFDQLKRLLERQQIENQPVGKDDDALASFIDDIEKTTEALDSLEDAKSEQAQSFAKIEAVADSLKEDDKVRQLKVELSALKLKMEFGDNLITNMKVQATANRHRLTVMEDKLEEAKHFPRRIKSLEDLQRKLREENKQSEDKMNEQALTIKKLRYAKAENSKMKKTLDEYIAKNKKSEVLIHGLREKLASVQAMAEETKQSMENFKNQPAINVDDCDLQELQDTLDRALREKQFIEDQYLELLDKVDESTEVADQLQRTQNECAMLEQSYLTLVKELESSADESGDTDVQEEPVKEEASADEDDSDMDDNFKLEEI